MFATLTLAPFACNANIPHAADGVSPAEQERIARQRAVFIAVDDALDGRIRSRGAIRDEERQEMLLGRVRTNGFGRVVAIIEERALVVFLELPFEPAREGLGVRQRGRR